MKKLYFFMAALTCSMAAFAQTPSGVSNKKMPSGPAVKIQNSNVYTDNDAVKGSAAIKYTNKAVTSRGVNATSFIRLGSTYYDLQSNYAMPHRLVMHKDGGISAGWTSSYSGAQGFPGRGTGYNYMDPSTKKWLKSDSNRVENVRTGWPCIGVLSNGNVFTIGHDATNGGFYMTKSTSPNSKPSVQTSVLQDAPYKPIWARAANNGDTIHVICSYTDSASPGEKRAPTRKGIFAPMVYSRSLDGGATWDIKHIMLPNYDSTVTNNGGADQYAIDCKGNTVVVANADLLQGVLVWKSTDFGTTWTRLAGVPFKYAPWDPKVMMTDTPYTCDGSVDVLIDQNNKVHAFYGIGRVFDDDTTDQSYSFYPGIQGIGYWNEDLTNAKTIAVGGMFDNTGDGINSLSQATYSSLSSTGTVPTGMSTVARLGSTSAMRQPNASIDANGNIYCAFSVPIEGDVSDLDANFRDIGLVFSKDGGATWSDSAQNLTQVIGKEDDFGTISRVTDNFLHMMWQQDEIPGTNLQNNSSAVANHDVVLNVIYYQALPVDDILNNRIGLANVDQINTGDVMVVNQNYPNPFEGTTNVMVWLTRPGNINVEVRNMMGALVKTQSYTNLLRGNHELTIDGSNLTPGVYTYSLIAGGNKVSKTFIVK